MNHCMRWFHPNFLSKIHVGPTSYLSWMTLTVSSTHSLSEWSHLFDSVETSLELKLTVTVKQMLMLFPGRCTLTGRGTSTAEMLWEPLSEPFACEEERRARPGMDGGTKWRTTMMVCDCESFFSANKDLPSLCQKSKPLVSLATFSDPMMHYTNTIKGKCPRRFPRYAEFGCS